MPLVPNFSVTSTRQLVLSSKGATTRSVRFTNNNVGSGSVYFQTVDHGFASTLTTANGTLIPSQPNPYVLILTPGYQPSSYNTIGNADDTDGFDIYLISNTTAQVSVQTSPF